MQDPWSGTLVDIYHDTHPHWVMNYGCYAVTLRCKGRLPLSIQDKLKEIGLSLNHVEPTSADAEAMRRKHFAILDHTLDQGLGTCPFSDKHIAATMSSFLAEYNSDGLHFDHWAVMPNHLHLITAPQQIASVSEFQTIWRRFKSRSAQHINLASQRSGSFWQNSWYDRWIRSPAEHERWQTYLKSNPIKAGLKGWNYVQ